jgi:hypothetical protein
MVKPSQAYEIFAWSSQANEISPSGQAKPHKYLWLAEV